jgi:hypothetical protein
MARQPKLRSDFKTSLRNPAEVAPLQAAAEVASLQAAAEVAPLQAAAEVAAERGIPVEAAFEMEDVVSDNDCPEQPLFSLLPADTYSSGAFIKKPYNLVSLAILLLDPAAPGIFLNIPPGVNERIIGRGVREAAQSDIYILIVAIIKLAVLFLATVNFIIKEEEVGDTLDTIRFVNGDEYRIVSVEDSVLLFSIKLTALFLSINMIVPIICIVVNDVITGRTDWIKGDVAYLLTTRKIWAHALVQSGVYIGQLYLLDYLID